METLQRTANRGSISTGPYEIDNSLKLEDDNTEGMAKNFTGDGDRRTWTYSTWVKRTEITGSDAFHLFGASYSNIQFMTNDLLRVELYDGSTTRYADLNRLFRDTSAWYHIVVALDSTQSTAADRVKIYINGVQDTSFNNSTYTNMSQNDQFDFGSASANYQFGYYFVGGANDRRFCGYVAETHYVNGTALDCTSFGEFDSDSGIWIPKQYSDSHGTKGFYLKFDDSSNLGKDSASSGIGDFTLTNITAADQATDTPTNNFCTLNPLFMYSGTSGANPIITEGATVLTTQQSGYWHNSVSTIAVTSGKWYFEAQPGTSSTHVTAIGYGDEEDVYTWGRASSHVGGSSTKSNAYLGSDTAGSSYGRIFPANSSPSTRVNYTSSNIVGVAIDADNGYVYWAKDNTWINSGDPTSGASGTGGYAVPSGTGTNGILLPSIAAYHHTSLGKILINFGGYTTISISSGASDGNGYGTFEYAPPSGYLAICTKNLASDGGSA